MNENIDLYEILENYPVGTKLWSPLCGVCYLVSVNEYNETIQVKAIDKYGLNYEYMSFHKDGKVYPLLDGECLLFPSKEERNWRDCIYTRNFHFKCCKSDEIPANRVHELAKYAEAYEDYTNSIKII